MSLIRDFSRRLRKLEAKRMARDAVLSFPNGNTRQIHCNDPLALLLASFRREHSRISNTPREQTPYDEMLDLLSDAEQVEAPRGETLFQLAWEEARQTKQEESEHHAQTIQ